VKATVALRHRDHDTMASVHLDALRALAALTVFLSHARGMFLPPVRHFVGLSATGATPHVPVAAPGWPAYLMPSTGHQAVILFFVLSGVLVGGSVLRDVPQAGFSWRHYLLHRLSRLWVPLLPALVIGGLIDAASARWQLHSPLPLSWGDFLGNFLFLQDILVPIWGGNAPLWSLSFEWWFYLAFPLAVMAAVGSRRTAMRLACLAALLAIGWFVGPVIALYFLIWVAGAVVTLLPRTLSAAVTRLLVPGFAVLLVVVAAAILKLGWQPPAADFALAIVACGFCYVVLNARQQAGGGFYCRAARFGAAMSYTLYLVHFPAIRALHRWATPDLRAGVYVPLTPHALLVFAGLSLLVLVYAYILFRLFEAHTGQVQRWLARTLGWR
jgi:peptidoglycan/LPS O-acetylase OafA/YrhL